MDFLNAVHRSLAVAMLLLLSTRLNAQISPGELSAPHAALEGVGNCTACHTIGRQLSNTNCLTCHEEIAARQRARKGFHGTLQDRSCTECHKEHHGRSFRLIRFDEGAFRHESVGFPLRGSHAKLACRSCHDPGHLRDAAMHNAAPDRKASTFLGLGTACIDCHKDVHTGSLGARCEGCHTQDQWRPAPLFSHDRARFRLTGRHASVACARCHAAPSGAAAPVQFHAAAFASCTSCHRDPHGARFGAACDRCHGTESWNPLAGTFRHDLTRFPLKGRHQNVPCAKCHTENAGRPGRKFAPVKGFEQCSGCHRDPHDGQFQNLASHGACESCHTVEGFLPATFTLERHRETPFELRGSHRALPCAACHPRGPKGVLYRKAGSHACSSCHDDVHGGQFAVAMSRNDCEACHTVDRWLPVAVAHDRTRFPLDGKHRAVACGECHRQESRNGRMMVRYTGLPLKCEGCHGQGQPSRKDR